MKLGEMLKKKRLEWGLTQPQMAKRCNLPLSTYKNLEIYNGAFNNKSYPSQTTIQKLRRRGAIDYTYSEIKQIIELERKKENRKHKKKEKKNERSKIKNINIIHL